MQTANSGGGGVRGGQRGGKRPSFHRAAFEQQFQPPVQRGSRKRFILGATSRLPRIFGGNFGGKLDSIFGSSDSTRPPQMKRVAAT